MKVVSYSNSEIFHDKLWSLKSLQSMYRISLLKGIGQERGTKEFQNIRCTMENRESHHHQVEKVGHQSDITENRTSLQNLGEDKKKTSQDFCQATYCNIKGSAGLCGKYWSVHACDNLLYSLSLGCGGGWIDGSPFS